MAHLAVTVALLFLACVYAAPAPDNPRFTLAKDSNAGLGLAGKNSKAHGVVGTNKLTETPIEAPVDTGNNVPDVTLIDNVNAGAAFADGGGVATGVVTRKQFSNPQQKPFFG